MSEFNSEAPVVLLTDKQYSYAKYSHQNNRYITILCDQTLKVSIKGKVTTRDVNGLDDCTGVVLLTNLVLSLSFINIDAIIKKTFYEHFKEKHENNFIDAKVKSFTVTFPSLEED